MSHDHANTQPKDARARLEALIRHLEHVLPAQAPIRDFVHHNTLHGFQHLPFPEAVTAARKLTGTRGYLPLERFQALYNEGRITDDDLTAALDTVVDAASLDQEVAHGVTRRNVWQTALRHPPKRLSRTQLRWQIEERDALRTFQDGVDPATRQRLLTEYGTTEETIALRELWRAVLSVYGLSQKILHPEEVLEALPEEDSSPASGETMESDSTLPSDSLAEASQLLADLFDRLGKDWTLRSLLKALTGEDLLDELRPYLIRHIANHLDQGLAATHNPERQRGFYAAWRASAARDPGWLLHDQQEWQQLLQRLPDDPAETVIEQLQLLELDEERWPGYLERLMLEIPGWSGMTLWRSMHPGYAGSTQPVAMMDFLAVRLLLERLHAQQISRRHWRLEASLPVLHWHLQHDPAELLARHALYEGRLPEYLVSLGQRQVQEALQHKEAIAHSGWMRLARLIRAWRLAPAPDRVQHISVSGTAWPLFVLCQHLGLSGTRLEHLGLDGAEALLHTALELDSDRAGFIWLNAYERHYREQIFAGLAANHGRGSPPAEPLAQIVFCMDDREEGTRRHLEEINPRIETFGAAGFFGVAINWRGLDDTTVTPLCPIVVTPSHEVRETIEPGQESAFNGHQRWKRLQQRLQTQLFHHGRHGIVMALIATVLAAPLAVFSLAGRLLWPRLHARTVTLLRQLLDRRVATGLVMSAAEDSAPATPQAPRLGFTDTEQADRVQGFLRTIGLTRNFAPLVVLTGHGSMSRNNPHMSAYDCGACSGRHGGPNARVFAAMANRPVVRSILNGRGLHIPAETWFLGAEHNTCDDNVTFFDESALPAALRPALDSLKADLRATAQAHAQERCRRFASAPDTPGLARALRHVQARMQDFSQPRPELGHVTNATAFIGRRSLSRGAFFDRRAFLISYDPTQDGEGKILEAILLAAGPVGAGIALEYYFSTVNNEGYGCGTKTVHNLTGLFGVMEGASSDLRTGLPQQMIEIHEAMRLLIIVEHKTEVLTVIYERQPPLRELIGNGWVQLAAKDPDSSTIHLFDPARGWLRWQLDASVPTVDRSLQWFAGHRGPLAPVLLTRPVVSAGVNA